MKKQNSRSNRKLVFFYSSLVGFCEFVREQVEEAEDRQGVDEIMDMLISGAVQEIMAVQFHITKKELRLLQKEHQAFFDSCVEGQSYITGFSFYLAKIDDFLGTVSGNGRRSGGMSINPKRIARLEQMNGLIQSVIDILEIEYSRHLGYTEAHLETDTEKAALVIDRFDQVFGRRAA